MARSKFEDKVWFNQNRKLDGICRDVSLARTNHRNVLILAHFQSTLSLMESALRARSIGYGSYSSFDFSTLLNRGASANSSEVWLGLSSSFQNPIFSIDSKTELLVIFPEHHPRRSRDQHLLDLLDASPCKKEIVFHTALTDPLMIHFGGERIQDLMRRMGADEELEISHPLVSNAISNAQEKIDKQVQQEIQTQSDADWFKYNLGKRD